MVILQWKSALSVILMYIFTYEKIFASPKSQIDVGPQIRNCRDVQEQGNTSNGIYLIFPYESRPDLPLQVFCDMETDGGGWTVIQRRADIEPREDFFRTWMEYALGFGDLNGEFWLGNDHIHALTNQTLNEIRIDMADFEDNRKWAKYKFFSVHDRNSSYRLEICNYSGDAGNSFATENHQGMKFTTKDIDNDLHKENCAILYKGGWWYGSCHNANLNGLYLSGNQTSYADGVNWGAWFGYGSWYGHYYSLRDTEMKIRPASSP